VFLTLTGQDVPASMPALGKLFRIRKFQKISFLKSEHLHETKRLERKAYALRSLKLGRFQRVTETIPPNNADVSNEARRLYYRRRANADVHSRYRARNAVMNSVTCRLRQNPRIILLNQWRVPPRSSFAPGACFTHFCTLARC